MRGLALLRSAVLWMQLGANRWGRQGPNFHMKILRSSLDWSALQEEKLHISPERLRCVLCGNRISSCPKAPIILEDLVLRVGAWLEL